MSDMHFLYWRVLVKFTLNSGNMSHKCKIIRVIRVCEWGAWELCRGNRWWLGTCNLALFLFWCFNIKVGEVVLLRLFGICMGKVTSLFLIWSFRLWTLFLPLRMCVYFHILFENPIGVNGLWDIWILVFYIFALVCETIYSLNYISCYISYMCKWL
jgi:hypothetical protein